MARRLLAAPLVALALVAGACGSSDGADVATESPTTPGASEVDAPTSTLPIGETDERGAPLPTTRAPQAEVADGDALRGHDARSDDVPDVDLVDLATGSDVAIGTLVPAKQPMLMWLWAPH